MNGGTSLRPTATRGSESATPGDRIYVQEPEPLQVRLAARWKAGAEGTDSRRRFCSIPVRVVPEPERPRVACAAIPSGDVLEAPAHLRDRIRHPVFTDACHPRSRERLRDAVGAGGGILSRRVPVRFVLPERVEAGELRRADLSKRE